MIEVQSYAEGKWHTGKANQRYVNHAVTGEQVAAVSSDGLDFNAMLEYGRRVGGSTLRQMTFHERALMLKALAKHLNENKKRLYELSGFSGATRRDAAPLGRANPAVERCAWLDQVLGRHGDAWLQ